MKNKLSFYCINDEITYYNIKTLLNILKGKPNKRLFGTYLDIFRRSICNSYSICWRSENCIY